MDDLERVEISAYRTFFEASPQDVARELGLASVDVDAGTLAVETRQPADGGRPGPSHRNLLRAGFEPTYRQELWLPPD